MEEKYHSKLTGILQEVRFLKRVDWNALSRRLSEFNDLTPIEALEELEFHGILSSKLREGYFIILDSKGRNISPEGYCFTSKEYAEQYIHAYYSKHNIHLARIDVQ